MTLQAFYQIPRAKESRKVKDGILFIFSMKALEIETMAILRANLSVIKTYNPNFEERAPVAHSGTY